MVPISIDTQYSACTNCTGHFYYVRIYEHACVVYIFVSVIHITKLVITKLTSFRENNSKF